MLRAVAVAHTGGGDVPWRGEGDILAFLSKEKACERKSVSSFFGCFCITIQCLLVSLIVYKIGLLNKSKCIEVTLYKTHDKLKHAFTMEHS